MVFLYSSLLLRVYIKTSFLLLCLFLIFIYFKNDYKSNFSFIILTCVNNSTISTWMRHLSGCYPKQRLRFSLILLLFLNRCCLDAVVASCSAVKLVQYCCCVFCCYYCFVFVFVYKYMYVNTRWEKVWGCHIKGCLVSGILQ